MRKPNLEKEILNCTNDKFNDLALEIFQFQSKNCAIYRKWLQLMDIDFLSISRFDEIPYMPVGIFKSHEVRSIPPQPGEICFRSSSTTGQTPSQHFVPFPDWYAQVFQRIFHAFYSRPETHSIAALLPGYLDRPDSSLIYMVHHLMVNSGKKPHFYKNIHELKKYILSENPSHLMLIGVSYSLLDLAESDFELPADTIVMETGGMKGKRSEIIREELHTELKNKFNVSEIHSEYGMTELMSQAYSQHMGCFQTPPWMKVRIADSSDPLSYANTGKTGRICIADLANLYSCAFVATDDLGKMRPDGSFEVSGRFDFSEVRGCNLMWT